MTSRRTRSGLNSWRARGLVALTLFGLSTPGVQAALPPGNTVEQWNTIAENSVIGSGAFQNEGLIYMAYASLAMYNAAVAVEGGYEPYRSTIAAKPGASVDAAIGEAAYTILREYFPAQAATLDTQHTEALALLPDGPGKEDGRALGLAAAREITDMRMHDGRVTPIGSTSPLPPVEFAPGVWRLTPPLFLAPQTPWVASVQPFVLPRPDLFVPAPPPALDSGLWQQQFEEVKSLGAVDSSQRTAEQTSIARFWTANVIRQYNRLGREVAMHQFATLVDTARLLAMINVAGADAQIAVMYWKYTFRFWRPVTAIDWTAVTEDGMGPVPGFRDGNDKTTEKIGWRPLIGTPNHPEYPGAHGSITGAVSEVLSEFLGTKRIDVDISGLNPATGGLDATRHFDTVDQLREEIVGARLWAGLHYRGSTEAGVTRAIDIAHGAPAERRDNAIRSNLVADHCSRRSGIRPRTHRERTFEEPRRERGLPQQGFEFAAQAFVVATCGGQKRAALFGRVSKRGLEQLGDLRSRVPVHIP